MRGGWEICRELGCPIYKDFLLRNYTKACVNVVVRTPFLVGFFGDPIWDISSWFVLGPYRG